MLVPCYLPMRVSNEGETGQQRLRETSMRDRYFSRPDPTTLRKGTNLGMAS